MPSSEVFSELQDAFTGRRLKAPFAPALFTGGDNGAAFISRLWCDMRTLPVDWQRIALLREMVAEGY